MNLREDEEISAYYLLPASIIVAFSKHMMTGVLAWLGGIAPSAAIKISEAIDKQKKSLFQTQE